MDDSHRRVIVENPKLDRVENYESMNIDYVVEDYAAGCLVEKLRSVISPHRLRRPQSRERNR